MQIWRFFKHIMAFAFCCLAILAPFACCKAAEEHDAVKEARVWLTLIDQGQYETAWSQLSPQTHDNMSFQEWLKPIQLERKSWGQVEQRELDLAQDLNEIAGDAFGGVDFFITFRTSVEGIAGAKETVSMSLEDAGWQVVGYVVESDT